MSNAEALREQLTYYQVRTPVHCCHYTVKTILWKHIFSLNYETKTDKITAFPVSVRGKDYIHINNTTIWLLQHAMSVILHFFDGTHRFDDPVSKTTLNFWAGVPIPITP